MNKEDNRAFYQAIGNSIQENKDKIEKLEKQVDRLKKKNKKLQQELTDYKERNKKAIEWVEKHKLEWTDLKFKNHNVMVKFNEYANPQALLEILYKKDFNDMTHMFDNATSIEPFKDWLDKKDKE